MRTLLTIALLSTTLASAQTVIPVGPFRSVELHDGGNVIVRRGQTQRVTLVTGSLRCTQVRLAEQRLVIEHGGRECPRHERMQLEVVTPELWAVAVSNGGTVQSVGAFPVQPTIKADVEQGGTIDIRSMAADAVDASVYSGGRIFTSPRATLAAAVQSGGVITYWGDARVRQAVRGGGVVQRGTRADAAKPLSELGAVVPAVPPVPVIGIR